MTKLVALWRETCGLSVVWFRRCDTWLRFPIQSLINITKVLTDKYPFDDAFMGGYRDLCVIKAMGKRQLPASLDNVNLSSSGLKTMLQACWEYQPELRPNMARCHHYLQQACLTTKDDHLLVVLHCVLYAITLYPPPNHLNRLFPFVRALLGSIRRRQFPEGRRRRRALLVGSSFDPVRSKSYQSGSGRNKLLG